MVSNLMLTNDVHVHCTQIEAVAESFVLCIDTIIHVHVHNVDYVHVHVFKLKYAFKNLLKIQYALCV